MQHLWKETSNIIEKTWTIVNWRFHRKNLAGLKLMKEGETRRLWVPPQPPGRPVKLLWMTWRSSPNWRSINEFGIIFSDVITVDLQDFTQKHLQYQKAWKQCLIPENSMNLTIALIYIACFAFPDVSFRPVTKIAPTDFGQAATRKFKSPGSASARVCRAQVGLWKQSNWWRSLWSSDFWCQPFVLPEWLLSLVLSYQFFRAQFRQRTVSDSVWSKIYIYIYDYLYTYNK